MVSVALSIVPGAIKSRKQQNKGKLSQLKDSTKRYERILPKDKICVPFVDIVKKCSCGLGATCLVLTADHCDDGNDEGTGGLPNLLILLSLIGYRYIYIF